MEADAAVDTVVDAGAVDTAADAVVAEAEDAEAATTVTKMATLPANARKDVMTEATEAVTVTEEDSNFSQCPDDVSIF